MRTKNAYLFPTAFTFGRSLHFIGKGFSGARTLESNDGRPLPNLEDPRDPLRFWDSLGDRT